MSNLTGDRLYAIVKHCTREFDSHPAGYFLIRQLCQRFLDEYEDQGVTIERFESVNRLQESLDRAMASPSDIGALDQLVRDATFL